MAKKIENNIEFQENQRQEVNQIKLRFLILYLISAGLLIALRLLLPQFAPWMLFVSVGIFAVGVLIFCGKEYFAAGKPEVKRIVKKQGKAILYGGKISSAVIFAAGVTISLPLFYLGDFIVEKSGLDYGFAELYVDNFFLYLLIFALFGVCVELLLRRPISNLVNSGTNTLGLCLGGVFFGLYFLDPFVFFSYTIIFVILEKMSKSGGGSAFLICCSSIFNCIYYCIYVALSLDGGATSSLGISGLLGMIMLFCSMGCVVIYLVEHYIYRKKISLQEGICVFGVLILLYTIGCCLIALH